MSMLYDKILFKIDINNDELLKTSNHMRTFEGNFKKGLGGKYY